MASVRSVFFSSGGSALLGCGFGAGGSRLPARLGPKVNQPAPRRPHREYDGQRLQKSRPKHGSEKLLGRGDKNSRRDSSFLPCAARQHGLGRLKRYRNDRIGPKRTGARGSPIPRRALSGRDMRTPCPRQPGRGVALFARARRLATVPASLHPRIRRFRVRDRPSRRQRRTGPRYLPRREAVDGLVEQAAEARLARLVPG